MFRRSLTAVSTTTQHRFLSLNGLCVFKSFSRESERICIERARVDREDKRLDAVACGQASTLTHVAAIVEGSTKLQNGLLLVERA